MEVAIERLVALCCFVAGLSHLLQPRVWAELFIACEFAVAGAFLLIAAALIAYSLVSRGAL